jgi:hypothetical protein
MFLRTEISPELSWTAADDAVPQWREASVRSRMTGVACEYGLFAKGVTEHFVGDPVRVPPHPFLIVGALALVSGLWGGLLRAGMALPAGRALWILSHGPLMVCGFLGTLISVERATALGRPAGWLVPAVTAAGTLGMVAGPFGFPAVWFFVIGSVGLTALLMVLARRRPDFASTLLVAGSVCWMTGNLLWVAGWTIPFVVPWWVGFLVVTIAGERLELSSLRRPSKSSRAQFSAIVALLAASLLAGLAYPQAAFRLLGLSLFLLAVWLLINDLARVTVRTKGVTRFTAVCLLTGFVWLAIGGLSALIWGNAMTGLAYDAVLHAVFVGFVFAMIFGHAPIVFPAVIRRPIDFRPIAYLPLGLLHVSLAFRLGADAAGWSEARFWAAALNAIAIVGYLAITAASLRRSSR